jgi:hypothetical protein
MDPFLQEIRRSGDKYYFSQEARRSGEINGLSHRRTGDQEIGIIAVTGTED